MASSSGANSASLESESLPKFIPNFELKSTTSSFLAGLARFRDDLHANKHTGAGPHRPVQLHRDLCTKVTCTCNTRTNNYVRFCKIRIFFELPDILSCIEERCIDGRPASQHKHSVRALNFFVFYSPRGQVALEVVKGHQRCCAIGDVKSCKSSKTTVEICSFIFDTHIYTTQKVLSACVRVQHGSWLMSRGGAACRRTAAPFTATSSGLHTSSVRSRTGHYKITPKGDLPLTYEQANPPHRIGVTKAWNTWNAGMCITVHALVDFYHFPLGGKRRRKWESLICSCIVARTNPRSSPETRTCSLVPRLLPMLHAKLGWSLGTRLRTCTSMAMDWVMLYAPDKAFWCEIKEVTCCSIPVQAPYTTLAATQ